jgi:hypothetical protein
MEKDYYYINLDIKSLKILNWGITKTATLTGDTSSPQVHQIFLTKGQFNKLTSKLAALRG